MSLGYDMKQLCSMREHLPTLEDLGQVHPRSMKSDDWRLGSACVWFYPVKEIFSFCRSKHATFAKNSISYFEKKKKPYTYTFRCKKWNQKLKNYALIYFSLSKHSLRRRNHRWPSPLAWRRHWHSGRLPLLLSAVLTNVPFSAVTCNWNITVQSRSVTSP